MPRFEMPRVQTAVFQTVIIQLRKTNVTPLAILGVKWPFSKGRGG